ncbi:hypothetical protein FJTKL_05346 [Diaporthe vaccinii]|uniref:WW domain-containing protein n=1 Tax=Diaporthe vaccinii TaxID=105482 RepID=A0ABR4FFH4_9PEZI
MEIPPWDKEFMLPPDRWYFTWINAGNLGDRRYKHPPTTHPLSIKGIHDGHGVAGKFRQRLEAARAAHRGSDRPTVMSNLDGKQASHRQNDPSARERSGVDKHVQEASDIDDHTTAVAQEPLPGATSREGKENMPDNNSRETNGSDVEDLQEREIHESVEETIVVSSSDYEPQSSSTPAPSTVVSDPFDPSYSPRSPSSDDRNMSVDPTGLDEDFDIDDYNDPPRSPSTSSEGAESSESDEGAQKGVDDSSRACPGGSPSAVEALRAIQTEMIPGYEDSDSRSEQSTRGTERSDMSLLFPGLATCQAREEQADS